jgi:hypothetical protein
VEKATERRLLQAVTAIACLVPLTTGASAILRGVAMIRGIEPPVPIDLDSHFRYLSGLLLGIGIAFACAIPTIERRGELFRWLGTIVFIGGVGRLMSLVDVGVPGFGHRFGLAMELLVTPLIVLWQMRVARMYGGERPRK